jgi:hypothetical protein
MAIPVFSLTFEERGGVGKKKLSDGAHPRKKSESL